MNKIRLLILAVAVLGCAALGIHNFQKPVGEVHAQSMIRDQTFGWSGNLASTSATVVTAATMNNRVGGPAVINPTAVPARFHVKSILVNSPTAGFVGYYEHPTSGSDTLICFAPVAANTPTLVKAGNNEPLGIDGYITAPGSSIKALFSSTTSTLITHTLSAALE